MAGNVGAGFKPAPTATFPICHQLVGNAGAGFKPAPTMCAPLFSHRT
jgi:hypothetical protein